MSIPAERLAVYRQGLRRRLDKPLSQDEQIALETARREAREIAQWLVEHYGAKRVILFGSVARGARLRFECSGDRWQTHKPDSGAPRLTSTTFAAWQCC